MSIVLSVEDRDFLKCLAGPITKSGEEADKVCGELVRGFEVYATEELIQGVEVATEFSTREVRESYFRTHAQRLLENLKYVGRRSEEVFIEEERHIFNAFKRMGIPNKDLEDMTENAIVKFWMFKHAEKFNPLVSSWSHHLYLSLTRMVASYWEKRQRDPLALGFSFQQCEGSIDAEGEESSLEPYELDQGITPYQRMVVDEALGDFKFFLQKQKPYRRGLIGSYKECCVLLPPGTKECPLEKEVWAGLIRKSDANCRVELEGQRYLWPTMMLKDIRKNDESDTDFTEQIIRTPQVLYSLLMAGDQVDVIAKKLRVGPSTVHNWIRRLQELFQEWWFISPFIHVGSKWQARPVRRCLSCGEDHLELPPKIKQKGVQVLIVKVLHWRKSVADDKEESIQEVEVHWCDVCYGWSIDTIVPEIYLPYPWGVIRGTEDLQLRSAKYKPRMTLSLCSI